MRFTFLVNRPLELTRDQTTTLLLRGAAARGHEVWVVGVAELGLSTDTRVTGRGRRAPSGAFDDTSDFLAALAEAPVESMEVTACDALLIRTNPGRDGARPWAHETALELATVARERGLLVLGDPDGLVRAASKLYLTRLPERVRPRTLVDHDRGAIRDFISAQGTCVLKPLHGTRGRDVFVVDPRDTRNLNQIIEVLTRDGYAMVQEYVPEATDGDTRVVLMDGRPLEVGGHYAAVRRVPGAGDFRSNVAVGGTPAPGVISPAMWDTLAIVGPVVRADGLFLVGADFIGSKIVELNVYSTGGLWDAGRFAGVDFCAPILDAIEARVG